MADLGARCDTIILFLNTAEQCEECLQHILASMKSGTVIIGSTILPEDSIRLSAICAQHGVDLLDAPVSGGTRGAQDATLTVMISGNKERAEQCHGIFECYGKNIFYVGEKPGAAQVLKAINQHLVGINIAAVCEAYALGVKCGLDPNVIAQVIPSCAGTSRIFENRSQFIIKRDFNKRSSLQIQTKDLSICRHLADNANMQVPLTDLCIELYNTAMQDCDMNEDSIAVIKLFERLNKF